MAEDYWGPSLKMLSDMRFLDNLKSFDKDNIPPAVIKKIRDKYQHINFINFTILNLSFYGEHSPDILPIVTLFRIK